MLNYYTEVLVDIEGRMGEPEEPNLADISIKNKYKKDLKEHSFKS